MLIASLVHQENANEGVFAEAARRAGAELVRRGPGDSLADADAAIVFGGSPHPDQDEEHGWIPAEVEELRGLVERGTPVLGVCLGGELLARALGAAVGPVAQPEIGWFDVELTREGRADPVLGCMPPRFEAFQWHSYGFALPEGAVPLAESSSGLQAFRFGGHAWGVQFHPEVTETTVLDWAAEDGLSPEGLVAETKPRIGRWNQLGRALCTRFVEVARGAPRSSR